MLSSLSWEKSIAFVVLLTWYIYLCVAEFTSFCLSFNDLILFCAENLIISQPLEEILCAQSCGSSSTYLHSTQRDGCKTMLLIYWYYTNEMLSKLWIMTIQHYLSCISKREIHVASKHKGKLYQSIQAFRLVYILSVIDITMLSNSTYIKKFIFNLRITSSLECMQHNIYEEMQWNSSILFI